MSLFRPFASKPKVPGSASAARQLSGKTVGARLEATPGVTRYPTDAVQIYARPNFLPVDVCARLIALIDINRRPSTLLSDETGPEFRTSDSCDMDRWAPDVRPIDEAIAELLGIDPANTETMQGQRYAPGQHFRAHHDYFHQAESYWQKMSATGGQRTWTAMVYLNDVEEGGATWFPRAGVRVSPQRGLLLAWNNMNFDGSPNEATLHEGMAVVTGVKYIVTKWFREAAWLVA
ncbi:prolyl hydroxylase family protein [Sphingomonas bacterium]|uniref:prolyl hydroxylase family protein n=1 Tax=Sphingomonas bacterium TaxID=1895847 RepID=UPI001576318F|nr:2OG-Fe(II) oxygenase [Sphingomonas bacterium]